MLKTYMLFHTGWHIQGTSRNFIYHCSMDKCIKYQDNTENDECTMLSCYGNLCHTNNNYTCIENITEHKEMALLVM